MEEIVPLCSRSVWHTALCKRQILFPKQDIIIKQADSTLASLGIDNVIEAETAYHIQSQRVDHRRLMKLGC